MRRKANMGGTKPHNPMNIIARINGYIQSSSSASKEGRSMGKEELSAAINAIEVGISRLDAWVILFGAMVVIGAAIRRPSQPIATAQYAMPTIRKASLKRLRIRRPTTSSGAYPAGRFVGA